MCMYIGINMCVCVKLFWFKIKFNFNLKKYNKRIKSFIFMKIYLKLYVIVLMDKLFILLLIV